SCSGTVGGNVSAATFDGADSVSVTGAVTGRLSLSTGAGDDSITIGNTVGGRMSVNAGAGDDSLTVSAAAQLLGPALLSMGAGADRVTLDDAATITTLFVNGGRGTDTFSGMTPRTGLTLTSF